ncbi:MAG: hypothetical protein A3H07_03300 [Candidatus Jacksonbacteria bacterium RIFCSPLOWO2_12_FULL_44_15b]|nr:MAG: hypothetical protein A3H07_03300 [Candidatus Jacksonbacteria bacterium RIFCSPLOWO2_12_FULL_44_15b]
MILLITFISAIANLILGFLVFRRNRSQTVARLFLFFTISASVWIATNFFWLLTHELYFLHGTYSAGILFGLTGLLWTHSLTKRSLPAYFLPLTLAGVALSVLSFAGEMIVKKPAEIFTGGFQTSAGPAFVFYALWMALTLGITLYTLFVGYRSERSLQRIQIKYVFIGGVSFVFVVMLFDFIFPIFFNYFTLASMDAPSSILLIGITAYATLRYRLMDVNVILRKSFIYCIIGLFSYATFHAVAWTFLAIFADLWTFPALLSGFVIAIGFAIVLPRAERVAIRFANTYLYANFYSAEETFKKLSDTLSQVVDLEKLAELIVTTIGRTLTVKTVGVAVSAPRSFELLYSHGLDAKAKQAVSRLLPSFKKVSDIIFADNLERPAGSAEYTERFVKMVQQFFNASHTKVIIPLRSTYRIVGVIVLGAKRAGRGFTGDDTDLLDTLRKQAAIAIENALLYQTLKESNESLKNLLTIREEFLDIASHQLRTPISIIRGASKLFLTNDPLLDQNETAELIYDASVRLNTLVDSMLLASRVGAADFSLDRAFIKPVPLLAMIREIFDSLKFRMKEKRLAPRVEISPQCVVNGYERYLSVVFLNLIENAIKYTPKGQSGEICVFAREKGALVRISVKDHGIGIPKNEQLKLFQKFARAANAMRMVPDGTGLGLFIVKKIIDAHPLGACGLISAEDHGAEFWVELQSGSEL